MITTPVVTDAKPTVALTLPSTTLTVPGSVVLTATASDDKGIVKVEFYDNTVKVGEVTSAPYTLTRTYAASDAGAHVIRVVATDTAGQMAEDSKTLTAAVAPTVQVSGVVSLFRAGTAVGGATVSVIGTTVQTLTDDNGRYTLAVPVTAKNLLITKDGYASTRIENIDTSAPLVLDEILQRSFQPDLPSTPPTVTTDLVDGATIGGSDLNVKVTTITASPSTNGPSTGIVSVGSEAGSSGFLNAGRTRVSVTSLTGNDTFTFKASDLAGFSGNTDVHIDIYDFNGNRTHLIRHVKVTSAAKTGAVVAPTALTPTAITFAQTNTYGALSLSPQAATQFGDLLQQWSKTGNAAGLRDLAVQAGKLGGAQNVTPQAASTGTVLWVDVNFKYDPAAPAPRSFELYRSLDGQTYTKVLSAAPSQVLKDATKPTSGLYIMRDNSSQLTPGVQTTYKVRAVSDTATQDSAVTTVTPLPRYNVELVAPGQAATGVETAPIFRWKTSGASDKESLLLLLLDRNQAEGKTTQWQSDVSGKTDAIYNFDGAALSPYLQPFHAYDWQLAAVTYNTAKTAYSIGADFFNAFAITANPVTNGPINEFVTGGY
ncbi:Ig-like domain-containing protein [Deinococcus altitudinis]|uniref:Ig-like domain-containing protein n=1 Tax=Deinococcus altitudinis TaxID=468914 RepID=UPI003891D169